MNISQEHGAPYCGNCGYDLTGATTSSKCPECGLPLVEILMRSGLSTAQGGKRFSSKAMIGGRPIVDIAIGPQGQDPVGRARGFIAIGTEARGVLAIGGQATGVVAIGGFARGFFSLGGMSFGVVNAMGGLCLGGTAIGGWAMGGLAQGGGAMGLVAQGGMAFGWTARGGMPLGMHTIGPGGGDPFAVKVFNALGFFFGGSPISVGGVMTSVATVIAIALGVAALIGLRALRAYTQDGSSGSETFDAPA